MKRIRYSLAVLALLGSAGFLAASCAKTVSPMSPNIALLNSSSPTQNRLPQISALTAPASVSGTAQVVFDLDINPATVHTTSVLIYTLDGTGLTETRVTGYGLVYDPASRMVRISPPLTGWVNDRSYHVVITNAVTSLTGKPLDGNKNGIPELWVFDNVNNYFNLGAPLPSYNLGQYLRISSASVVAGGNPPAAMNLATGQPVGGLNLNVSPTYAAVTLTVVLALNTGTWPADFDLNAATLEGASVLTNSLGVRLEPFAQGVTSTTNIHDTLQTVYLLAPDNQYQFLLHGGLVGIQSSSGMSLNCGLYLDGNNNNKIESGDDTKVTSLRTLASSGASVPYVRVSTVNFNTGNLVVPRRIEVQFTVPTGNGTLDPAAIIPANFLLYDTGSNQAFAPERIELDNQLGGTPWVYLYIPLRIYVNPPAYPTGARTVSLTVTKSVRSSDGAYMDQNNDQVTLTDLDNYRITGSVYNY